MVYNRSNDNCVHAVFNGIAVSKIFLALRFMEEALTHRVEDKTLP